MYYSGIDKGEETLKDWMCRDSGVIVATKALGLGVDVSNVRLVVHIDEPDNLLEFAQETGRAGRDDFRAESVLLVTAKPKLFSLLTCFRQQLGQFLDGNESKSCLVLANCELCQVCALTINKQVKVTRTIYQKMSPGNQTSSRKNSVVQQNTISCASGSFMGSTLSTFPSVMASSKASEESYNGHLLEGMSINEMLEAFHGICIFCKFKSGEMNSHAMNKCPFLKSENWCFKCLGSNHRVAQCSNRLVFDDKAGLCFVCSLPASIGKTNRFHSFNCMGGKCDSKGKDMILPICWCVYRAGMTEHLIGKSFDSEREFANWIVVKADQVQLLLHP